MGGGRGGSVNAVIFAEKKRRFWELHMYISLFHDSEKENISRCEYDACILVLEGDWMWIAAIKV